MWAAWAAARPNTIPLVATAAFAVARAAPVRRQEREIDQNGSLRVVCRISKPAKCEDANKALRSLSHALLTPTIHYAELHGLLYAADEKSKVKVGDPSLATQCPIAMLPFRVPGKCFNDACALAPLWNQLVDTVARDLQWLYATLETAANADPFTGRLVEISKAVHAEGLRQGLMLGIHRSDYMLHEPEGLKDPRFLQVELNTIASSMSSHAANITSLHGYLLGRYGSDSDSVAAAIQAYLSANGSELLGQLPSNPTLKQIPAAIAAAHHAYDSPSSVVIFIVQDTERNFADQRWIEYVLWEQHKIQVVRKTLADVAKEGSVDPSSGRLCLQNDQEVSVVYFRAGYSPDDYPSEIEWSGRVLVERSLAIKCPSVDYQLVGAKKVQQALARPGAVERFLGTKDGAQLRGCFAGLWGLGRGENDAHIIDTACKTPHDFVLKPQREGGGNNYYGDDVATKLREFTEEERSAYILMQRIMPKPQDTVMTRAGSAVVAKGVAEFGFYSVFLGDGKSTFLSEHAGHLVRTKAEGVDEGGVAAGYAVISSPYLTK